MNSEEPKPVGEWSGKTRGGAMGVFWLGVMFKLLKIGGLRAAYAFNIIVSLWFVFFAPRASRASQEFLKAVGAINGSFWERWRATWKHYYVFGQLLIDRAAIIGVGHEEFKFDFDGEEELERTLKEGKGAVLVTAHIGGYEASTHMLFRLQVPVHIVAFDAEADRMREFLETILENKYFSVLKLNGTAEDGLEIMSILRRGEVIALLADRNLSSNAQYSTEVSFLGKRVRFPTGPYHIAAVSGAPLIVGFVTRRGTYDYSFRANPAKFLKFRSRKTREEDINNWAQEFANELEEVALAHPYQWRNFYSFWEGESSSKEDGDSSRAGISRSRSMSPASAPEVSESSRTTDTSDRTKS